jgi:hypothetical protein
MITEALTMIPEFLEEIVTDTDRFLRTDDYCFLYDARKYAKRRKISKAVKLLDDFRYRRKKYKDIFFHRVSVDLLIRRETEKRLRRIEKTLKNEAKHLEIMVDSRPGIRPVGIEIEELPTWLTGKRIYDPSDGKLKKIQELCPAYHRRLTQYVILFRVYANREQLKKDPNNVYNAEKRRVADTAKQMLNKLDEEYEALRTR